MKSQPALRVDDRAGDDDVGIAVHTPALAVGPGLRFRRSLSVPIGCAAGHHGMQPVDAAEGFQDAAGVAAIGVAVEGADEDSEMGARRRLGPGLPVYAAGSIR